MSLNDNSILLIGESGVGKTHYGAQLLKRLMKGDCALEMDGQATNLEPFAAAMDRLNEGMAAEHTASNTYVESIWPVTDKKGRKATLMWPDYAGEQIRTMASTRRIPSAWLARVEMSDAWLFFLRLQQMRVSDDIFSRPLGQTNGTCQESREVQISDQARLIELLQMLLYIKGAISSKQLKIPLLTVIVSCWDELGTSEPPPTVLEQRLPMVSSFIQSTWANPNVLGLSALERPLSPKNRDVQYASLGPEQFGYIVLPDGTHSKDLTMPIQRVLDGVS